MGNSQDKTIMLALSTFRHSEAAIEMAIDKAKADKDLVIIYIVDVNLARYFIGSDIGFYENLQSKCEKEILEEHKQEEKERVNSIVQKAKRFSINVNTHIQTGRFALKTLPFVERYQPKLIVTTRSKRPKWVKRFFGSPVDYLIEHTPCPVIEA